MYFFLAVAMAVALTIAAVVLIVGVPGVIAVIYRCFFKKKKEVLPTLNDVPDHKDPPTEPKDTGSYDGMHGILEVLLDLHSIMHIIYVSPHHWLARNPRS